MKNLSALNSTRVSQEDIVAEKAKDLAALELDPFSATKVVVTSEGRPKTIYLGKKEGGKVYARVEGWDRVNRVEERLFTLADRSGVYRSLKLFDLTDPNGDASRVESVTVQKGAETFGLQEVPGSLPKWNLTGSVRASATPGRRALS